MVVKILVKCDSQRPNHRLSLLQLLRNLDLQPTNIIPRDNSFLVIFKHNFNQDVLFSQHSLAKLKEIDCSLAEPPNLRARRTILVFRVDPYVYGEDLEDIARDIESSNAHSKIEEIIKFPNSRTLKIIFSSEKAARLAAERGLIAFYLHIPPEDIEQEIYIEIQTCLKCYALNDHATTECDRARDYKICSLCSSKEHTHRQCTASLRKCINCGGAHSTMSSTCEMRKETIKDERKKQKSSRTLPSNVPQSSTVFLSQPSDFPALVEKQRSGAADDTLKCYMALVISSWKNKENPGSFNVVLNKLLSKNNLPAMDASDIETITPDSPLQFSSGDIDTSLTTTPSVTPSTKATSSPDDNTIATPNFSVTSVPSPNTISISSLPTSVATTCSPVNTTVASSAAELPIPQDNTGSTESVTLSVATTSSTVTDLPSTESVTPSTAPISTPATAPAVIALPSSSVSQGNKKSTPQPATKRELRSSKKTPVITIYSTKVREITENNIDQLVKNKKIRIFSNHPSDFVMSALKCDPSCAFFRVVSEREFEKMLKT